MRLITLFTMLATISAASADPLPIPKGGGSAPHGYTTSGGYYVPRQGAQDAIPKPKEGCPFGWTASGDACLRSGR
jgi:hypothetical protein